MRVILQKCRLVKVEALYSLGLMALALGSFSWSLSQSACLEARLAQAVLRCCCCCCCTSSYWIDQIYLCLHCPKYVSISKFDKRISVRNISKTTTGTPIVCFGIFMLYFKLLQTASLTAFSGPNSVGPFWHLFNLHHICFAKIAHGRVLSCPSPHLAQLTYTCSPALVKFHHSKPEHLHRRICYPMLPLRFVFWRCMQRLRAPSKIQINSRALRVNAYRDSKVKSPGVAIRTTVLARQQSAQVLLLAMVMSSSQMETATAAWPRLRVMKGLYSLTHHQPLATPRLQMQLGQHLPVVSVCCLKWPWEHSYLAIHESHCLVCYVQDKHAPCQ